MNYQKIQKLKMYLTARVLLRANPEILAKLPNAQEYLTALDAAILSIQTNSALFDAGTEEIKELTNAQKDKLVAVAFENANKLKAYASYKDDKVLLAFCTVTEKKLGKLEDVEIIQFAKTLYSKINEYGPELIPYQLTPETQGQLQLLTNQYEVASPELEKAKSDHKKIKAALDENYKAADLIMGKLDNEMEIVRSTESQFYSQYQAIRKVDLHSEPNQLVGHVLDAETGAGVPNATVTLTLNDGTKDPIVKQSAEKGGFQVKTITPGYYTVTMTKIGYQTQTLAITIMGDNPYNLEIKAMKAANPEPLASKGE